MNNDLQAQENSSRINSAINELDSFYQERMFRDFWQKVKQINELFKNLKPLERGQREYLWERFTKLCEQAKEDRRQSDQASDTAKHSILSSLLIRTGTTFDSMTRSDCRLIDSEIRESQQQLAYILEDMKQSPLNKSDRQECWNKWVEISNNLRRIRGLINDQAYESLEKKAYDTLNDWERSDNILETIKELQKEVRDAIINKDQRQNIRRILEEAWENATKRINGARKERHESWRRNQENWIEKLEGFIANDEAFIGRLEGQISDLEDQISESHSDNWIERARGWIEEKQDKIREVKEKIRDNESKIAETQEKLDE